MGKTKMRNVHNPETSTEIDEIDLTLDYLLNIEKIIFGDNGKCGMLNVELLSATNNSRYFTSDEKRKEFIEQMDEMLKKYNEISQRLGNLRETIEFILEAPDGYTSGPGLKELESLYTRQCDEFERSIKKAYSFSEELFNKYGLSNHAMTFNRAKPTLEEAIRTFRKIGLDTFFGIDEPEENPTILN